eukprot:gnl/Spiro4/9526_TR5046_c0_g1_i1.p1 gnl/Spiro4/9526_TR5046_c0_g1~~gnl/Spiro4/9526_TR5046_c0_g1_i1.p1  ORF type:complete len:153 (+),score=24.28 gnl/Spiro4/9526_TR5046_c0_g1_i1:36-494(+)
MIPQDAFPTYSCSGREVVPFELLPLPTGRYHSQTFAAVMSNEDLDEDSDDDADLSWQESLRNALLEEFQDVTATEKIFMKAWNEFVLHNRIWADHCVVDAMCEFADLYGAQLIRDDCRSEICLHLYHWFDIGLLSPQEFMTCLQRFDKFMNL